MKKMNSTSKRKWILGGTLGFCAVALLTTGFATWIIGVNQTKDPSDTTVTVDTTKNQSAVLKVELSDSAIKLAETEEVTGDYIKVDTPTGDLEITFSKITFSYGDDFLADGKQITGISFSLPTTVQDGVEGETFVENAKCSTSENSSGLREGSGPWTYIEAPDPITEGLTPTKKEGLNVIELTDKKVNFKWGSYFKDGSDNLSPANFYNKKLKESRNVTVEKLDNVDKELKAMKTAFDENSTIKLLAEVTFNK